MNTCRIQPWIMAIVSCGVIACNEAPMGSGEDVAAIGQAIGGYNFTDHRAWSQSPPGGLSIRSTDW